MKVYFKDGNVATKNLTPGISVYGEELIQEDEEYRIWNPRRSKLAAALLNGLENIGGNSSAPQHTETFCGAFCNMAFIVASQFMGAIATPEFFCYLDHFLRKDYGDDYYKALDNVVELGIHQRTLRQKIEGYFAQVVYTMNQPAAARGAQSIFWNVAYFDKNYFSSIFQDFVFPDGDEPCWESTSVLQKLFMKLFVGRIIILLIFDFFITPSIAIVDFIAVFIGAFLIVPITASIKKVPIYARSNQVIRNANVNLNATPNNAVAKGNVILKCTKCGNVLNVTDKFCQKCGTAFSGDNVQVIQDSSPVVPFDQTYMQTEKTILRDLLIEELKLQGENEKSFICCR